MYTINTGQVASSLNYVIKCYNPSSSYNLQFHSELQNQQQKFVLA